MIRETKNPQEAKVVSVRVSLRCMLRLIRVDTLRRVHTVSFLADRLICKQTFVHQITLLKIHVGTVEHNTF